MRKRIVGAFEALQNRPIGPLVEENLLDCHSSERAQKIAQGPLVMPRELEQSDRRDLDEAVFEVLGVTDPKRRVELVNHLHTETALHFRHIRVGEIQKMEQRRGSATRRFSSEELAADLWDAAELEDLLPLKQWLAQKPDAVEGVIIPDAAPVHLSDHTKMFDNNTVYFGKNRKEHVICKSRDEAELVKLLSDLGVNGIVNVPANPIDCMQLKSKIEERTAIARARFEELARTRTNLEEKQAEVVNLLLRWFVLGRPATSQSSTS